MSLIDDAVAAVTPAPSNQDRLDARDRARAVASEGDWLSLILDHHVQLEQAFAQVLSESSAQSRMNAFKQLGVVITGHAGAEETVIYPAMDMTGESRHADHAYQEQVTVKKGMAELEQLDPMTQEFQDKLEDLRDAVARHMVEEEGEWFPDLRQADDVDQGMLTARYREEYERYVGAPAEQSGFML